MKFTGRHCKLISSLFVCFFNQKAIVWHAEFTGFSTNVLGKKQCCLIVFSYSLLFFWQITLLFFLLKVALMHFDAIWLRIYSSLWFLHFLTTSFQTLPESYSQRACLNRRSFTQVLSLLTLASCQVTSARAMHCFVTFVFFSFIDSIKYIQQ